MDAYLGSRTAWADARGGAAQPYARDLRLTVDALIGTVAQLSAALLAASLGLRDTSVAHGLVCEAAGLHRDAVDRLRTLRVPKDDAHHHRHLERASSWIGAALTEARRGGGALGVGSDAVLRRLRSGWRELNAATSATPGVSVLNLAHCCGLHGDAATGWLTDLTSERGSAKR